jgi:hypothetical protein
MTKTRRTCFLKTRYSDGTSHLLFSGLEFIETSSGRTAREAGSPLDCAAAGGESEEKRL